MITVFTPTYNRAYSLHFLYESLIRQTCMDFEWLIVDDGSSDDTELLVNKYISEARFPIRYVKQVNGGKHRAINKGVLLAKGNFFFIVDSDDYITDNAIEILSFYSRQVEENATFAGVAGLKCYKTGETVNSSFPYEILDVDLVSCRQKYHIHGDMAEVWKTEVLKKYPFPEFPNEKFMTEAVVWNEISKKYKLRYFNKSIYVCEYLNDGLSMNIRRHHRNSPLGTMLFYTNLMKDSRFSIRRHIIDAISYWRYTINYVGERRNLPLWSYLLYPIGWLYFKKDLRRERK